MTELEIMRGVKHPSDCLFGVLSSLCEFWLVFDLYGLRLS